MCGGEPQYVAREHMWTHVRYRSTTVQHDFASLMDFQDEFSWEGCSRDKFVERWPIRSSGILLCKACDKLALPHYAQHCCRNMQQAKSRSGGEHCLETTCRPSSNWQDQKEWQVALSLCLCLLLHMNHTAQCHWMPSAWHLDWQDRLSDFLNSHYLMGKTVVYVHTRQLWSLWTHTSIRWSWRVVRQGEGWNPTLDIFMKEQDKSHTYVYIYANRKHHLAGESW